MIQLPVLFCFIAPPLPFRRAVIGLEGVASVLDKSEALPDLSTTMKNLASTVRKAIKKWAIIKHPGTNKNVYAFEVDCYGSHVLMDDANFPSLLSLPFFGFVAKDGRDTNVHYRSPYCILDFALLICW